MNDRMRMIKMNDSESLEDRKLSNAKRNMNVYGCGIQNVSDALNFFNSVYHYKLAYLEVLK